MYNTLIVYYVLGFFWTYNWIAAIFQCTIAGAISTYYWTRDKKALPSKPVLKAFGRTLRFHLGSLAFGSLILAVIQTIRAVLMYMQRTLKRYDNRVAQSLLTALQCCCGCVESIVKLVDKNAYIQVGPLRVFSPKL